MGTPIRASHVPQQVRTYVRCGGTSTVALSGSGTGPSTPILLNSNDDVVCTFVNDRIAVPTISVVKDATTFTREWGWTIRKQALFGGDLTEIPTGTEISLITGQTIDVDYKFIHADPTDNLGERRCDQRDDRGISASIRERDHGCDCVSPGDIAASNGRE